MNNGRLYAALTWSLLALAAQPVLAQGDPQLGKAKASTCMGCHSIPGYTMPYPTYHVPKIGGQHADYLVGALKQYRTGERKHGTMQAQASNLSDQDIQDIAAYFASGN